MAGKNSDGRPYTVSVGGEEFWLEVWQYASDQFAGQATDKRGAVITETQGLSLDSVHNEMVRRLRTIMRRQ